MRKYILVVFVFLLASCTLGGRQAKSSKSAPTSVPAAPANSSGSLPAAPATTTVLQKGDTATSSSTLYVAPNGKDSWSGTLPAPNSANTDGPFATFDRARAAVQASIKTGAKPITVEFRAGTYFLSKTEEFTAADSGTSNAQITYENYPNETPIISGGIRVLNWTNAGGNTWKATLPASTQYFENLFYNGVRRLRPRLGGYLGTYYRFGDTVYLKDPHHQRPHRTRIVPSMTKTAAGNVSTDSITMPLTQSQLNGATSLQPQEIPATNRRVIQHWPATSRFWLGNNSALPSCASAAWIRRITSCT